MKKIILTASWFAVAVYCILSGVFGPSGLNATAHADDTVAAMLNNMALLEKLNAEYTIEWNALRNDADLTAVQGRSLGFIASNEMVVRVALPLTDEQPQPLGERVLYEPARSLQESGIRAGALTAWLVILCAGITRKLLVNRKQQPKSPSQSGYQKIWPHREMRVQDASRT